MTLKHPMPTIRHNPQRSTINHNKLTNYPPQCIPHTYGCTIANIRRHGRPTIGCPSLPAAPRRLNRGPYSGARWSMYCVCLLSVIGCARLAWTKPRQ